MHIRSMVSISVLSLALSACASLGGEATLESSVVLGPGGRAEGHVAVPAGVETEVELENKGPGRADYVMRTADGVKLATGALHEASVGLKVNTATVLTIVIEAYEDAGTTVEYEIESGDGVNVEWDLSRAFHKVAPK
ncbi:MAG: hypothetical protein K8T90_15015 [Planctomycetes bacterium]|nr:hypothetical protein [Planctomycetota bacterium]